jgi:chromosome segregation ATPase
MSLKNIFASGRLHTSAVLPLLFSIAGSAYAFDVIPGSPEDVIIYLTFIVLLLTFSLAFINFRNIRYEKKLMDEERTELIKQRLRLDEDLEKEKEEVAVQKKSLEKELSIVNKKWEEIKSKETIWEEQGRKIQELRPEGLEEARRALDEDKIKLEHDMQVIADQLKELEDIKRQRSEDMQKIEDDKKRIEEEWHELENQKAFLGQNVSKVESQWDEIKGTEQKLEDYKAKIEDDQKRIELERLRIQKEEKKIEDDRKKMDADLKEIESMWLDVENAMKRIEEERRRLR